MQIFYTFMNEYIVKNHIFMNECLVKNHIFMNECLAENNIFMNVMGALAGLGTQIRKRQTPRFSKYLRLELFGTAA